MKKKGRNVIIDHDPEKPGFFRKLTGHALGEKVIISEMNEAGYTLIKRDI